VRRVLYFILTNIAVLAVFSIVLAIISPFLPPEFKVGNAGALIYAAIFGFTGSLISLLQLAPIKTTRLLRLVLAY